MSLFNCRIPARDFSLARTDDAPNTAVLIGGWRKGAGEGGAGRGGERAVVVVEVEWEL